MSSLRRLFSILPALVVIVVVLFLSEVILRGVVGIVPTTDRMVTYQFDETLGWKTRSDYKYYRSSLYYGQFNYYNPEGFPTNARRWHEHTSTTTPSVAIVGSSFAESYYLPYEESFPYLIEQKTGKQVINLGVSGYAPDQYLLRMRAELPKYDVKDIVVIFFPHNDLSGIDSDRYQGFTKPYFKDSLDKPANAPFAPPASALPPMGLVAEMRNTAIYTLLRPIVRKSVSMNLNVSAKTPEAYDQEHMERVFRMFTRMKEEHPGARLTIYLIPFYREIGNSDLYQANLRIYQDACTKHALSCASMDTIIASHPNVGEIFIEGDGHVTAYGAKLVADQLASILSATGR